MKKLLTLSICFAFFTISAFSQGLTITKVDPIADEVTVTNLTSGFQNIANMYVCTSTSCINLGTIITNSASGPGDFVVVNIPLDNIADNVIVTNFGPPPTTANLTYSFMQYGAASQNYADFAVSVGQWDDATSFVDITPIYVTDTGGNAAAWTSCGDANLNAGLLEFPSGDLEIEVCVDGNTATSVNIDLIGTAVGSFQNWIIADQTTFEILDINQQPPFNITDIDREALRIYHVSYEAHFNGLRNGDFVFDLDGCFDLSNSVTINRNYAETAFLFTDTGSSLVEYCANGGGTYSPTDIIFSIGDNIGANEGWILVDVDTDVIIDLPSGPPFLFDTMTATTANLHHIRYNDGVSGLTVGLLYSDILGCFSASNPIVFERIESVECDMLLNTEDVILNTVVSIYPNPMENEFTLDFNNSSDIRLEVFDALGKKVIEKEHLSKITKINLNQFSSALFFIKLTNKVSGESIMKKIIKK